MISTFDTLFESSNKQLTIKGDDPEFNSLLIIVLNERKFSFQKYPENLVSTLDSFRESSEIQQYFALEDYSGLILRTTDGYRLHLEMTSSYLNKDDLIGVIETIQDYFQSKPSENKH